MTDVRARIAIARTRFGKLRHLRNDKCLNLNLLLRFYKSCVYNILTYGSVVWYLDEETTTTLIGANAVMVSVMTGKTQHQEESPKWKTFDLVVRTRRLHWIGHILRMGSDRNLK